MEKIYVFLKKAYDIFKKKFGHCTDNKTLFQMAIKALNDTAGPNGFVPTLLVFGAYFRINYDLLPLLNIVQRIKAVSKTIKMLTKIRTEI